MGIERMITVPGTEALATRAQLRDEYARNGLYPIILGEADAAKDLVKSIDECLEHYGGMSSLLAASDAMEPRAWFEQRNSEIAPDLEEAYGSFEELVGTWPEHATPSSGLIGHTDIVSGKPLREVAIALVPVAQPWDVFTQLAWGGWNECPDASVHRVLHRYWNREYQAEPVTVTGDVVECLVMKPPRSREAALELAREQFLYCEDIVFQGTETLAALAATLLDGDTWFFWWD